MLASIGWRDDRGLLITAGAEHELLHALYRGQTIDLTSSGAPREVFAETTASRRDGLFVDVTRTFVRGVRTASAPSRQTSVALFFFLKDIAT